MGSEWTDVRYYVSKYETPTIITQGESNIKERLDHLKSSEQISSLKDFYDGSEYERLVRANEVASRLTNSEVYMIERQGSNTTRISFLLEVNTINTLNLERAFARPYHRGGTSSGEMYSLTAEQVLNIVEEL